MILGTGFGISCQRERLSGISQDWREEWYRKEEIARMAPGSVFQVQ